MTTSDQLKFPKDFHWGYATASAQVEGSIDKDGKGPSIWDAFSKLPGSTSDGTDTSLTTDTYNKWAEDIELMKSYGVNSYRMSLSWSRIIPLGGKNDPINQAGIDWYRKVIQALLDAGITPFVTLFHWDLPLALEDEYKGFLSRRIVPDFERYARVCFDAFGDLVQNWFTINEPNVFSLLGYVFGSHAPGRSSNRKKNAEGDSKTERFIVAHNLLLSHASAVKVYREEFKPRQGGKIGLVVNMIWGEPFDDTPESATAAEHFMAQSSGGFIEPIVFGDYPPSTREIFGDVVPRFTEEERALVKGSSDFLGINHYTTFMIKKKLVASGNPDDIWSVIHPTIDLDVKDKDGNLIGEVGGLGWLRCVPWGFGKLLDWTYKRYGLDIYITENGTICPNENELPMEEALQDDFRIDFLTRYADQIAMAISRGTPVKAHLMWAFTDNFEWQEGHEARFGVTYIDYKDGCKRHPKKSASAMKEYYTSRIEKA